MPYISMNDRTKVRRRIAGPANAGELNYAITKLFDSYLKHNGLNYQNINDCVGAAEGAKLELYRRVAAPYEDKKREENGDVFSPDVLTD